MGCKNKSSSLKMGQPRGYRLRRVMRLESVLPPLPNNAVITTNAIGIAYPKPGTILVVDGYGDQLLAARVAEPSVIDVARTGGYAAVGGYDGYLGLYGVSGAAKWTADLSEEGGVISLALHPGSLRLAVGTATGGLLVYDESGLVEWRRNRGPWFLGSRRPVYSVSWSRNGSKLLAASGKKLEALSSEGDSLWRVDLGAAAMATEWSPSDGEIAVATRDRRIVVVDSEKGSILSERRLVRKPLSLTWMSSELVLVGTGVKARNSLYGSLEVLTRRGLHVWSTCDLASGPIRSVGPAPPLPIPGDYLALPSPLEEVYVIEELEEGEGCIEEKD